MFKVYPILLISVFLLSSCATTTSQQKINESVADELPDINEVWVNSTLNSEFNVNWSDRFNDAKLKTYIKEALTNNKDLAVAAANVDRSWALARQAGAALKPSIGLTAGTSNSGNFTGQSDASNSINLGAQVNWEIDIWGRVRSGVMAAQSSAEATELDFKFAKDSLAATVTRAYLLAVEANLQLKLNEKILADTAERVRIVQVQFDNGMVSSQDVSLIQSEFAAVQEQIEAVKGGQRNATRALEVLMGRYPSAELELTDTLPDIPELPSAGLPSDVLERRPDVIAAERRVAASFNRVDQAKAAKLPSISLTSTVGGTSGQLSDILDPANTLWTIGSNLLAPLFDGGSRDAQLEAATAEQKQALASYGQTALNVFQEVESSLDLGSELESRLKLLELSASEAQKALNIVQLRYNSGETDLLDVLTVQQRVTSAESNLISLKRNILDQRVNLHLALGGQW
ncbi:efflux transporter outer membrane subunit [Marinicella sp. W31]|uniref:efflux transporter outer membrane subunit n=1 Tax=Marinicella sp. W31 TaxID=3023713 RepID=UPI0037566AB2